MDINIIIQGALRKRYEELTEVEQMALALKGALNCIKVEEDLEMHAFYAAFIGKLSIDLKERGISFN